MSTREVELTGGAPWGFRMHGGVDQNQPLRISRVNPGRKASLSGIREGDVISSINGKTTKDMSNSDAHAMLRFSGPVLRLGLNEDRDTSPRRRSIPKATELKRPSQLIDGAEKATPHPPVYATIKQPNSPNKLPAKSPSNKSVQLVKSFEDTQNFHPTNPFYSTLPNTKLQITNGKSNSLQRSVNRTNYDDLKMSSFFKKNDPGAGSPNAGYQTSETSPRRFSFDKFSYDVKDSNNEDQIKKNPFNNGTNDFNPTDKLDGSPNGASMIYSKSDSNFRRNEFTEYTERKSVTEEMISETEEIKTIKKITLNGSSESDKPNGVHKLDSDRNNKERIVPMTLYDEGIKVNENRRNVGENTSREEYKEGDTKSTPVPAQSPSHITTQKNQPIWRPGVTVSEEPPASAGPPPPPPPPVWSPSSTPQASRKFKPVHFEQTPPERRKFSSSDHNGCTSGSESEGRLRTSLSAPAAGLNSLGSNNRLPRAQNPTVTLLQKAREGQLQRNIPQESDPRLPRDRPSPPRGDPVHALRKEYASESEADRSDHERGGQKMADGKKIDGIGPITKDGMPVALRSEVKDPSRWYKKMYDTIHKNKYDEDYVTIRYKNNRGETLQRPSSNRSQYAYFDPRSGYLSEPEGGRPTTDTRRRTASVQDDRNEITPHKYSTLASSRVRQEVYKNQPGRIEDYVPGKSSVIDTEAKQWWDEVMDIFDGQNESNTPAQPQPSPKDKKDLTSAILSKSNMARALKESGYESDSTIVFRRQAAPLSPSERRAAYRDLQAGGEPPRGGFRSPAPNRQDETEIEYIPISPTLTKIRIHKKTPQMHEVICYPITCNPIEQQYLGIRQGYDPKFQKYENDEEGAPIPPTRISSRNSQTLKFMTSKTQTSGSPVKLLKEQSNVEFLKDKISNKLNRQNTHIIIKPKSIQNSQRRIMSTSAPPVLNRNKTTCTLPKNNVKTSKPLGTSSFSSERRIILPINYPTGRSKSGDTSSSVIIEGGVGRRTPITNILDKVTQIDKLWGSQKRNERIDVSKIKPKSIIKSPSKPLSPKTPNLSPRNEGTVTHKSRDMIRTAEKIQNMKVQAKSTPCLAKQYNKSVKSNALQIMSNMSTSSPSIQPLSKKQHPVKTATVTNLKKKKSLESISLKPRHTLTNEQTIKKVKYASNNKKLQRSNKTASKKQQKDLLSERDTCNQFGDNLDKLSNKGSVEFLDQLTSNDLREARNTIVSDSFFQHLFLRDALIPPNMQNYENVRTSVLQKAKYFQSLPDTNVNFSNSLNTYLVHRKPVSLSRFKLWDSHSNVLPISSSRSISWPGKMDGRIRKFESLTKSSNEFGSSSSLSTVRSKSEPPCSKLYFSQTSRPISPTVTFHKKQESSVKKSPSPVRFFVSHRSLSPNVMNKTQYLEKLSRSPTKIIFSKPKHSDSSPRPNDDDYFSKKPLSEDLDKKTTFFFSETSRPVSPQIRSPHNRSQSTSPAPVRSPSYRRIHNVRAQNKLELTNKKYRTLSADNAVEKKLETKIYCRPKSDSNLNKNDPEYEEYINDIQNATNRSIRFRELNRYYSYLERVAELEKATNNQNSCYRKRDEEIIDFDRWKKIRTIERAEEELDSLYKKLRKAQNENDVLFYPKDVNDLRWNFNKERGLRMKEKSVEDLKEELEQKTSDLDTELDCLHNKDTYKPLWRGTSVAETAFTINRKNEIENKQICNARNTTINSLHANHLSDLRRKIGLGSRLWSSLSMDQVNALKNQLNAIYSRELETKLENNENYTITVKDAKTVKQPDLHVRCNSLTSPKTEIIIPEINKSESIAAISCQLSSEKKIKNNVNKMQMSLTETEKKKLSQSLSKELLKRINKFDTPSPKSEPEKQVQVKIDTNKTHESKCSDINHKLNEEIIKPKNDNIRHLIFPVPKQDTSNQSSASETDTLSSDISGKTVIYRGPAKEVQKKVQYFESVKDENEPPVTVHLAKDTVIEKNQHITEPVKKPEKTENKSGYNSIVQSQSCSDLKELFGESEANKFLSLPAQSDLYSRTPSPQSEVQVDRITPDTLRFSSDETIWRSRTPSPDPERYWRAYLKLAREGEVRRLARRFDSPSAAGAVLRRYRSDPEIIRNDIKNNWPTDKAFRRGKCRSLLPVARMPLRPNNRFMPHIDVISKLAALRKRNTARSRSAEEVLECRPGEVERIRRRFEAMSLLGQMYTSTPDVCELQNITSYLAGPWIAHRYPKPEDNKKPIRDSDNNSLRGRTTLNKKDKTKTKGSVNLNSILKSDSLAKQAFNPLVHQPASRYEPPRTPPRPPSAAWPYRLAPYVTPSRHTVTFKEGDTAPEPPRRASQSCSDSESPNRRYIESDVNIHYRCPVRHDPLPLVPERELARQQADHMKRLYREQRRNKYLQENSIHPLDIEAFDASIKELQDMQNRRHQDNFMPSQKTIVPLNRYDEAERIVAKALYTFNGQTSRELSFRKGDIINVRRQIDSNWYEGEVHGKVGLFPYNYVELMKGDGVQTLKKTAIVEGRAKAKFDFTAQTNLELPLKKGEVVVLTRRIDHNWWEGRTGNKTGIFPDSYVTILQEPSQSRQEPEKPVGTPAAHGLMNGDRPTSHRYTPQHNSPALSNAPPATAPLPSQGYIRKSSSTRSADLNNTEPLYVDTNAEAVPYRAMYKYRPQNPDELELLEGETVYVLEKCDDGWYVGSSQRTGRFGTFPGNYVERI